jgi:2-succinyl-6-hydroxy-2,4-cyclohexadiene-1-carboxylate synthase
VTRESRFVDVAGARLHFAAEGEGETLVLLHGFTGSAHAMAPLARELAGDHRVVSIDLLGHGLSDAPQDPARYCMESCIADVIAVLDALGAERAHLLGYSMGGRIALALAVAHPDRIASAVLIGASAGLSDPGERAERRRADEALARSIELDGVAPFVERWMALPLFATQTRLPAAIRDAARAQRLSNVARGLAGSLRGLGTGAQPPLHDALRHCPVPLLLLAGEHDAKFRAIAGELAALAKRASHEVVPDAGHAAQLENPRDVVARARRFVGAHSPECNERNPMSPLPRIPDWKAVRSYEDIRLEKAERMAKITICRPEVRNASGPRRSSSCSTRSRWCARTRRSAWCCSPARATRRSAPAATSACGARPATWATTACRA